MKKEKSKTKAAQFPVSTDHEFLDKLNEYCLRTGTNRSRFARIAIEKELNERLK